MDQPILRVEDLKMHYKVDGMRVRAVDGLSFQLYPHRSLGVVGESGCGKSSLALALLKIPPKNAEFAGGSVVYRKKDQQVDLLSLSEEAIRPYRWKEISMVFQGAMNSLNPVYKVGKQIQEAIRTHEPHLSSKERDCRVDQLLEMVGVDPERKHQYPHQFSGGMKQRAGIAMALACKPKIIIADEPTTALDVIVQYRLLKQIEKIKVEMGMSILFISHDIAVIAQVSDQLAVMYAGQFVEMGNTRDLLDHPAHPYTQILTHSFPEIHGPKKALFSLQGEPPDLSSPPPGCRFHPRCPYVQPKCREKEVLPLQIDTEHVVICHFPLNRGDSASHA